MCGIFAAIQPTSKIWSTDELEKATNALSHRGPDASDYWSEGPVFFGHRRLSIIDLNTGAQPMISHDGRFVVIFNGEIYNYQELRNKLENDGHHFSTQSDTETIVESYRRWGFDCVKQLNGMFAFVLWDSVNKTIFAARDRLGIKPLCWTMYQGAILISSTLEPLLSLPNFTPRLNYSALRDVLSFDYIPAPRTIIDGVQKLRPGHRIVWRTNRLTEPDIDPYWAIPNPTPLRTIDLPALLDTVEHLLEESIARQMVSDVPLGAFLSGGIDSSLIVAFMARHSTKPVKTFSIAFKRQEFDESSIAQEVADQLRTEHTVLYAEETSCEEVLEIIRKLDEPFADATLIPTYVVAGLARQYVTVALSGDGGDEIFGGYDKYLLGEDRTKNTYLPWTRPLKTLIEEFPFRPRGGATVYRSTLTPRERIRYDWTRYGEFPVFRKDMKRVLAPTAYQLAMPHQFFDQWQAHADQWGHDYTTDLLMRTDLRTYLSENCLVKTDRASMMQSLEVRVPFLDELVLDAILPLHAEIKIQNGQLKALLVPLAQKLLPSSVWNRPKHGFGVPVGHYLAGPWKTLVNEVMDWSEDAVPIFNYDELRRLIAVNERSQSCVHDLWNPLMVLTWLYTHQGQIDF